MCVISAPHLAPGGAQGPVRSLVRSLGLPRGRSRPVNPRWVAWRGGRHRALSGAEKEILHLYWYTNCVAPSIGTGLQIHCKKGAVLMANPNSGKH